MSEKFDFVTKSEYEPFSEKCSVLNKLPKKLKMLGLSALIETIGSKKNKIVTRKILNGKKMTFDFDYNINLNYSEIPKNYRNNLIKMKSDVHKKIDDLLVLFGFKKGKTSRSAITYEYFENGEKKFSIDIALVVKNEKTGKWMRLQQHEKGGIITCSLEECREDLDVEKEIKELKQYGLWTFLREKYLRLKNENDDDLPSCILFKKAAKDLYNERFVQLKSGDGGNQNDVIKYLYDKTLSIKSEKRPQKIRRLKNFIRSLKTWKKLRGIADENSFDFYADNVAKKVWTKGTRILWDSHYFKEVVR